MSTKRIAFLSRYYKKVSRGAETYVYELSRRLESLGHLVKVLVDASDLKNNSFDIVIGVNGRLDNLKAKMWVWRNGAKFIIPGQSGLGIDDRFNLWLFPDVFIGLTDFQCQWAKKINPFVKIVKIPNGVDLQKFNQKIKPFKIDLPRPIVLSVGALEPIKRQDLIIKKVAQTKDSLLIVGKGSLEKEIHDLGIKMLGEERFRIMNFTHDQMPGVYTACDRFIFNSEPWESFGIVILEARASGLPVEISISDPIRQEIMNTDLQEFDWDKIVLQYNSLFKTL